MLSIPVARGHCMPTRITWRRNTFLQAATSVHSGRDRLTLRQHPPELNSTVAMPQDKNPAAMLLQGSAFCAHCTIRPPTNATTTKSEHKPVPGHRPDYRHFHAIQTRWMDNDVYGHVNNVVYYSWFDTAVNHYLVASGVLDIERSPVIGLVIETRCNYFASVTFPDQVDVGVRVAHVGRSSVRYEIGIFKEGEDSAAAQGHFVHVYVDRESRRPVDIPEAMRMALAAIAVG